MAPDVNTLQPPSPRQSRAQPPTPTQASQPASDTASRRTSTTMPPPVAAASASAGYAHPHITRSPDLSSRDQMPGLPMRHPRPLTAAELYLECEKEQEAVVNRLTRELTALRAQSASVASNASHSSTSTSASLLPVDISDPNPAHQMTGPTHPTPSRRHRSSSSLSTRSIPTPSTSASVAGSAFSTQSQAGSTPGMSSGSISQASANRAAAATRASLSRRPSISRSGASTPARQSLDIARQGGTAPGAVYGLPHRPSLSREPSYASTQNTSSTSAHAGTPFPPALPSPAQSPSQSVHSAMQHYADTTAYRTEMEIVKAENDVLKQRVRSLERALRARRRDSSISDTPRPEAASRVASARESNETRPGMASPAGVAAWAAADGGVGGVAPPRERSESQSTTASSRRATNIDDEVKVGESAGSIGVGRGQ